MAADQQQPIQRVTKAHTGASTAELLEWIQKTEDSVAGSSGWRLQQLQHILKTATHSIQQMLSQDTAVEGTTAPQHGVLMPNPDAPAGNSLARLRSFIDPKKRRRKQPPAGTAATAELPFIIQPRRKQKRAHKWLQRRQWSAAEPARGSLHPRL